jgi:secreted Zn-dependent insulinase-like peptidase
MLIALMSTPLLVRLRGKERLAYTVECGPYDGPDNLGLCIRIVSATHLPAHIDARARAFVRRFVGWMLAWMPAKTFRRARNHVAAAILAGAGSLESEASLIFDEIRSRRYEWERRRRVAAEVQAISQKEFAAWAKEVILGRGARMVSVHAYDGTVDDPGAQPLPRGSLPLREEDIRAFKRQLPTSLVIHKQMPEAERVTVYSSQ